MFEQSEWKCSKCGTIRQDWFGWAAMKVGTNGVEYICASCLFMKTPDSKTSSSQPAETLKAKSINLDG